MEIVEAVSLVVVSLVVGLVVSLSLICRASA
jgi:hypothetical protein